MKQLFELMTYFDWLVLPRTIYQSFAHADWRAARARGAAGMAAEAGASLVGANAYPFFVPLDGPWGAADIQNLLAGKGIRLWGLGFANGEMFFQVSRKQAAWAQYVMQRAGVPLLHGAPAAAPAGRAGQDGAGQSQDALARLLSALDRFLT